MEVLELREQEKSLDFTVGSLFDTLDKPQGIEGFGGERELDFDFSWALKELQKSTVLFFREPLNVGEVPAATLPTITEIEVLFEQLADEWESDTELSSRHSKAVLHSAYQQIIGLGPAVIPLLLVRLRDNPGHWFWALSAVSREDPAHGLETLDAAREAWLVWGRERGYID